MQCNKCQGKFDPPSNIKIENCPFCQSKLTQPQNINPTALEWKIQDIVKNFTPEIYNEPSRFKAIVSDLLAGEEIENLLKKIIDENASKLVYQLKSKTGNELNVEYYKILENISQKSFIPKETISPALLLLCLGLDINISSVSKVEQLTTENSIKPQKHVLKDRLKNLKNEVNYIREKNKQISTDDNHFEQNINLSQSTNQSTNQSHKYFEIENGVLKKYLGNQTNVVIPDFVTSIEASSFVSNKNIVNVVIPNSVNSILDGAFENCTNLINIKIPNSVNYIGEIVFNGCSSLTNITIPNSITSIKLFTFNGCKSLTNITLPDSVTTIGAYAFAECSSLTNIRVSNSVTSIGEKAFCNCISLTNITIPNSVTTIEKNAFRGCVSLNQNIKDKIISLNKRAFK